MSTQLPEGWPDPRRNSLLARLPDDEYERLLERTQPFEGQLRDMVYEENGPLDTVYFPLDIVFSLVTTLDGRQPVEVATIGNEGMVGLPAFLGAAASPNRAFCQIPGRALSLSVADMHKVLSDGGQFHRMLSLFAQAVIVELSQNVACNRLHSAEQRCARWLLMTHDRVGRDSFPLTQEFLAQMLGVRRATVSETASSLQDQGLIRYSRGTITMADRSGLERAACECYQKIRDESRRILES